MKKKKGKKSKKRAVAKKALSYFTGKKQKKGNPLANAKEAWVKAEAQAMGGNGPSM